MLVSAAFDRPAADLDETVFFELAGLATTFFVETDFVFFDVDFPATAFFVAPTFLLEVFFEVPFFAEGLVVLRALSVCRPVFLRLAAAERLVGAFRATLPAALLPVFF
ncbi:MAG: hypothetical protein C0P79_014345, partial [Gammaproteobacteria bacterium]